jgi:hypothetical protein
MRFASAFAWVCSGFLVVRWSEITEFTQEPVRADPAMATVRLTSGDSIHVVGLSQARLAAAIGRNPAAAAVRELNRLREEAARY